MDGKEFLQVADQLVARKLEAEWRSAVSRGYYAVFHVARALLSSCGFVVPRADQAHAYLWLRLGNCGHSRVQAAGSDAWALRRERNSADYFLDKVQMQKAAVDHVDMARKVIRILESASLDPIKTQITDAMRLYERDILKDVTWQP